MDNKARAPLNLILQTYRHSKGDVINIILLLLWTRKFLENFLVHISTISVITSREFSSISFLRLSGLCSYIGWFEHRTIIKMGKLIVDPVPIFALRKSNKKVRFSNTNTRMTQQPFIIDEHEQICFNIVHYPFRKQKISRIFLHFLHISLFPTNFPVVTICTSFSILKICLTSPLMGYLILMLWLLLSAQ